MPRPGFVLEVDRSTPPTLLWHLGVDVPPEYEGRVLRDAFIAAPEAVDAVA